MTPTPLVQTPPAQMSPTVQAFPSSQPSVLFVKTQPVAGTQESVVQTLPSLQTRVPVPAWQVPPPHVSPVVQALPSLHDAVLLACAQPVAGTQESSVHGLLSLQFSEPAPGWQLPPEHVSPVVQAFKSSHAAVLLVKTHPVAGAQLSVVHTLLSLQTTAVPAWQLPPPHVSPVVHAFPSLHAAVLFA